jgi:hypothetical protein
MTRGEPSTKYKTKKRQRHDPTQTLILRLLLSAESTPARAVSLCLTRLLLPSSRAQASPVPVDRADAV